MDNESLMKKTARIVTGVVIVAGALITAASWYTGTRLEGVLRDSVEQANQQLGNAFARYNGHIEAQLVSLERGVFNSTAHYKVDVQLEDNDGKPVQAQVLVVDHIQHGPFPWSRVSHLELMPVLATSNFALEKNDFSEKWFALAKDQSPVKGTVDVHFDRSVDGSLDLLPLEFADDEGRFSFSGLHMDMQGTANGEKIKATGNIADLAVNVASEEGPVSFTLKGLSFDTGGTKGASGFYLGHSEGRVASAAFQLVGRPPVSLRDFKTSTFAQETGGKLDAQVNYDVGMVSYNGKDIGSSQMMWKFANFDVTSTQALLKFYQERIEPQQHAAALSGEPYQPQLSAEDEVVLKGELAKLLGGKPHIELERFSLKTANGESLVSLSVDLANPASLDVPAQVLAKQILGELDFKAILSKPMVQDLVTLQAQAEGQTDQAAIAEQAEGAATMVGGMAVGFQLAKVEGDNVVSRLHYANDVVEFNGQKMTPQQFATFVSSRLGGLKGQ